MLGDEALRTGLGGGWQMVVANIVADVIKGLAPLVRSMLAPGGRFLCSGIIDTRAEEVAAKLREEGAVLSEEYVPEGLRLSAQVDERLYAQVKDYQIS